MLRALSLAFASLSDKRIMLLLAKVMAYTLLLCAALGAAMWFALNWLFERIGLDDDGTVSALASIALLLLGGLLLFRMVAVAITWVFADDIIDAVEARHYPLQAANGRRPGMAKGLTMGLRSASRALVYNLLALPFYIVLLITGIGAPLIFLGVNALLLGRDLEEMLIARHGRETAALGKGQRLLLGLTGTAGMMIPFVQFIVPVVATATAVHMAHGKTRNANARTATGA
jgi:CysZ protein